MEGHRWECHRSLDEVCSCVTTGASTDVLGLGTRCQQQRKLSEVSAGAKAGHVGCSWRAC